MRQTDLKRRLSGAVALFVVSAMPAFAQSASTASNRSSASTASTASDAITATTTNDSLFRAVDAWVARGLIRYQIAGAALAIVHHGRIVHQSGFGLADIRRGYRVDADTTQFHIASITKLLTAIAALQQVESGKLALDRDVRPLLGTIRAAGWSRDSVTLHQLLTHTAGLDTRWIGMAASTPTAVRSLAEYLPNAMPPIIDKPGEVIRYSNLGYVAVGRLVEIASGISWARYVEEHVLAPLGMTRSYAAPRLPSEAHATPYRYRNDTLPEPALYEHAAPSGAVHATATDVARLLIALMDSTSSVPLTAASKVMVLAPQHRLAPSVHGHGYGTFDFPNAHVHAVSFGGEVPGFSTRILMVPSLQLGVVLMVNRKDPLLAISVFDSLLARIPSNDGSVAACGIPRETTSAGSIDITGQYRYNVYDRGSFLRIGALLGPTFTVEVDTAPSLLVVNPIDNQAARWHAHGDSAWTGPAGTCMALVGTSRGSMLALSTKGAGPVMLEQLTWASNPAFVMSAAFVAGLVLAVLLLMELRRLWMTRSASVEQPDRRLATIAISMSALHWVFLPLFGVGLYNLAIKYDDRFAFGIPMWYSIALLLPYLIAALTISMAYLLARANGARHTRQRWLAVMSSVVLLVVFWNWRMMWVP